MRYMDDFIEEEVVPDDDDVDPGSRKLFDSIKLLEKSDGISKFGTQEDITTIEGAKRASLSKILEAKLGSVVKSLDREIEKFDNTTRENLPIQSTDVDEFVREILMFVSPGFATHMENLPRYISYNEIDIK
ncbi:hypothetical protein RCL_jg13964.t1 [Rhizophagus clarus]|uniref:Uncharacterized protein n=1 Tax=Rhizophagus clarus TaxID=94130 RepID=A0A8H3LUW9_9GLOM|nr:hypothetical protein RCL_jg13964.t1 [Rhizophagus clarus]